jgi:transposase-like protein
VNQEQEIGEEVHGMGKSVYSAKFKAERVIEVIREEESLGAIAARHNINPNMLRGWKKEFLEKSYQVFGESSREKALEASIRASEAEREDLLKTVGQLTLERDWLKKKSAEVFGSDYEKRFSRKP